MPADHTGHRLLCTVTLTLRNLQTARATTSNIPLDLSYLIEGRHVEPTLRAIRCILICEGNLPEAHASFRHHTRHSQ